jgi:hypothetical protein
MAASLLQYANREAVAQALTARGYTVSRATVNRWARGKEMPEIAGRMIAELFGHQTQETAPAWWAEAAGQAVVIATLLSAVLWATLFTANWQDYPTLRSVWPLTDLALLLALRRYRQLNDAEDGRPVAVTSLDGAGVGRHPELDGERMRGGAENIG